MFCWTILALSLCLYVTIDTDICIILSVVELSALVLTDVFLSHLIIEDLELVIKRKQKQSFLLERKKLKTDQVQAIKDEVAEYDRTENRSFSVATKLKYAQVFQRWIAFINNSNQEAVERGEIAPYDSPWSEKTFCPGNEHSSSTCMRFHYHSTSTILSFYQAN